MSEYPDEGYGDIEKAIGALLRPLVAEDWHIGNFLVAEYDQIREPVEASGTPFITIICRGGPIDPDDFTWYADVEVSCWGKTRQVAVSTADQATRLILQAGGEEIDGIGIDAVEDVTGPNWTSVQNPDDRGLTRVFQLALRPQYQL